MLFRGKSLSAAHSWEMGSSARPPREWSIVIHYLEFCLEELSLLSHLFSCLFMSTWTHKYVFHPLDYNPNLFIVEIFPTLDMGSSFSKIQISDLYHFSPP